MKGLLVAAVNACFDVNQSIEWVARVGSYSGPGMDVYSFSVMV